VEQIVVAMDLHGGALYRKATANTELFQPMIINTERLWSACDQSPPQRDPAPATPSISTHSNDTSFVLSPSSQSDFGPKTIPNNCLHLFINKKLTISAIAEDAPMYKENYVYMCMYIVLP
jgi:hypothetical protein